MDDPLQNSTRARRASYTVIKLYFATEWLRKMFITAKPRYKAPQESAPCNEGRLITRYMLTDISQFANTKLNEIV